MRGDYVRAMNDLGYHPSPEDIVRFRIHGVSPELVKTLTTLGYRNLSGEDLVRFRLEPLVGVAVATSSDHPPPLCTVAE